MPLAGRSPWWPLAQRSRAPFQALGVFLLSAGFVPAVEADRQPAGVCGAIFAPDPARTPIVVTRWRLLIFSCLPACPLAWPADGDMVGPPRPTAGVLVRMPRRSSYGEDRILVVDRPALYAVKPKW